jgi:HPt (histidine-containing phosphotransfer) domain-containing protein/CheY-like chemotaxis protein
VASTLRVLIVDGDQAQAGQISLRLSEAEHSVIATSCLDEASEILDLQRFDAVLLGNAIAGERAADFFAKLRALDARQRSPVRTAVLSLATGQEGSGNMPADGYLSPGFEPGMLAEAVARLSRALEKPAKEAPDPAMYPVFDREKLMSQAGGDEELAAEIVALFLSDYPNQISEMWSALRTEDFERLSYFAHTIKGSLGTLGAMICWARAQQLELASKRGSGKDCRELLPQLEQDLHAVMPRLKAIAGNGGQA